MFRATQSIGQVDCKSRSIGRGIQKKPPKTALPTTFLKTSKMFESDLQQRRQKFELESKRRSAEQKVKLQKLLKEKEAARKLEQRAHEEAKVKRLAAEAAREAVRTKSIM